MTSTPAELMGFGHRVGYVSPGYDADLVIWDAHPLALSATPKQVFIDGIPQLQNPTTLVKPDPLQRVPRTPDFTKETADAIAYDGLPPLRTGKKTSETVILTNVRSVWKKSSSGEIECILDVQSDAGGVVVLNHGEVVCSGLAASCIANERRDARIIDLKGGSVLPSLISYGAGLGLVEIPAEPSTLDGIIFDPIRGKVPSFLKDTEIRAVDGLAFGGRDTLCVLGPDYRPETNRKL